MGQPFSTLLSSTIIFTGKCQLFLLPFLSTAASAVAKNGSDLKNLQSCSVTDDTCCSHRTCHLPEAVGWWQEAAGKVTRLNSPKGSRIAPPDSGGTLGVSFSDGECPMPIAASSLRRLCNVAFPSPASCGGKIIPSGINTTHPSLH